MTNTNAFSKPTPSGLTVIPDGDNQARSSARDGEVFALNVGDRTQVADNPVLTFDDDHVAFGNAGIAITTGVTDTVRIDGDHGSVKNYPSGVIAAENNAISVTGDKGLILNSGLIAGGVNGVRFLGDRGLLKNEGRVESDSRAVEIIGTNTAILNYGEIIGTGDQRNGTIYANSTADNYKVVNFKHGSIDAGFDNNGAGISFEIGDTSGELVSADIVNFGSIAGRGDALPGTNARGDGVRLFTSVPDGTTYDGDIVNAGWITSDNARGIEIRDGLAFDGKVVNTGFVFGATDGLYFGDAGHDAKVLNRGAVASDSRAVNIDGTGVALYNTGEILGTGVQRNGTVYADTTADDFSIVNFKHGKIDAGVGGSGVSLQTGDVDGDTVSAQVKNFGAIQGRGDATAGNSVGDGVRLFSGVRDATFEGDIYNGGRINASTDSNAAVGISIENGITLDGKIVNVGRIVANQTAIDATDAGGDLHVVNKGLIEGDVRLSGGDDYFNGSKGRLIGSVEGGEGDDVLTGGASHDVLAGGAGDDLLTGGYGGDTFVFAGADGRSSDKITDFKDGVDRIDVTDFGFAGFAEIGVEQQGDDTVLTFATDNEVTLIGVDASDIGANDFLF